MQSVIHYQFGEPVDVLEVADMPQPEPKAGEVRIKTIMSPIHNHDVWTVRGSYGYKPTLPAIGGSEAVGIVDAVGEGVDESKLGQRVAVAGVHGSWAECFIAPAQSIIPLNDVIDDETAAQLIGMPISALMLLDFVNVQAGQWLIQNTANGAVGKTVAMIAQARGLQVINLVRRTDAIAGISLLTTLAQKPFTVACLKIKSPDEICMVSPVMLPNETNKLFSLSRFSISPLAAPPIESTPAING